MKIEDFFSPHSSISWITVLMCWAVLAYLTGAVVGVLLAFLVLTTLLAAAKAVFTAHGKEHWVRLSISEAVHTSTFAITAALIVLTLIPYLLPADALLDIYQMQLLLVAPTTFVFGAIVYNLHHRFAGLEAGWFRTFVAASLKTLFVCVLVIASTAYASSTAQNLADQQLFESSDVVLPNVQTDEAVLEDISEQLKLEYESATSFPDRVCRLCKPSDTIAQAADRIESTVSLQVSLQLAENVQQFLPLAQALPADVAAAQIIALESAVDGHPVFDPIPPSEYATLPPRGVVLRAAEFAELPAQQERYLEFVFGESPLHKSLEKSLQHTLLYSTAIRALDSAVTMQVVKQPPVIMRLYENRLVAESHASKLTRYQILSAWVESQATGDQ